MRFYLMPVTVVLTVRGRDLPVGAERERMNPSAPVCSLCRSPVAEKYAFGNTAVLYCSSCQFGQLAPLATADELAALYASRQYFEGTDGLGYADYSADAPQFARTFRAKIDRLLRYGAVHTLLEIGCGPGYFLSEAQRAGIASAVGVDPNPWAVDEARRRHLEAFVGSIDALPPARTFDAVVMLDVLEHIPDPAAFLAQVRAHLQPGGRMLIMTPNIRSALARVSGRRWVSFKIPEHVYYYSPRSIRTLLERCGFEILSCRGTGQYVTGAFFLDRLGRIVPHVAKALGALTRPLHFSTRVVYITNGSIDVVARLE